MFKVVFAGLVCQLSVVEADLLPPGRGADILRVAEATGFCQPGSLPYWKCNFPFRAGHSPCLPGVNTGQQATGLGCKTPSPENDCKMEFSEEEKAWMWTPWKNPETETPCCNCFQEKHEFAYCPLNTLPAGQCDFAGDSACLPYVNYGEEALANEECSPPNSTPGTPGHSCLLTWQGWDVPLLWTSRESGVDCCNCFQKKGWAEASLIQEKPVRIARHSQLRRGHLEEDAASMLQLPAEEDWTAEDLQSLAEKLDERRRAEDL